MRSIGENSSQFRQGYLYALRLLTASKKTGDELRKRLAHKGYRAEVSAQIVERLKAQKLLDDRALICDTIHWAGGAKRLGRRRIILELRKRGVRESAIQEAAGTISETEESERAKALARERWSKLAGAPPEKRRKRLYDYLVYRGFEFELCREIVTELESRPDEDV